MLPSPYGVLILLTMAENNCSVTQAQVAVPLRGSYLINSYGNAYSKMIPVAVPLRGSYLINLTEPFFTWKIRVAVPLRGSYLINIEPTLQESESCVLPSPYGVLILLTLSSTARHLCLLQTPFAWQNHFLPIF